MPNHRDGKPKRHSRQHQMLAAITHYRFRNIKVMDPTGKVLLEGLPDLDRVGPANISLFGRD